MIRSGGLVIVLGLLAQAGVAEASAWTLPKGQGQVILKTEAMSASHGFDPTGHRVRLGEARKDASLSGLIEYGLTDRLTLQAKSEWQWGEDAYLEYDGRGPIEVGARFQVYRDPKQVISVYAGYAKGGRGRNAGYALPGEGDEDVELRLLAGRSSPFYFLDTQVAHRWRDGLPDEVRIDTTLGLNLSPRWTVMGQVFSGYTEENDQGWNSAWLSAEASVVRHMGDWSAQVAWRSSIWGKEAPASHGPVVAIWRRF